MSSTPLALGGGTTPTPTPTQQPNAAAALVGQMTSDIATFATSNGVQPVYVAGATG